MKNRKHTTLADTRLKTINSIYGISSAWLQHQQQLQQENTLLDKLSAALPTAKTEPRKNCTKEDFNGRTIEIIGFTWTVANNRYTRRFNW